jgi:hypothetical protein
VTGLPALLIILAALALLISGSSSWFALSGGRQKAGPDPAIDALSRRH